MANSVSSVANSVNMDKQQPYSSELNQLQEEIEKIVIGCEQSCAVCYKLIIQLRKHIRETHSPRLDHNINPDHHTDEVLIQIPQDPSNKNHQNEQDPLALYENSENCSSSNSDRRLRKRKTINYAELNDGSGFSVPAPVAIPVSVLDSPNRNVNPTTLLTLIRTKRSITNPQPIDLNTVFIINSEGDQSNKMSVNNFKCRICDETFSNEVDLQKHAGTRTTQLVNTLWGRQTSPVVNNLDKTETPTHYNHQPRILRKKKSKFIEKISPLHSDLTGSLVQKSTSTLPGLESEYFSSTDEIKYEPEPKPSLGIEMSEAEEEDPLDASNGSQFNPSDFYERDAMEDSPDFKHDALSDNSDPDDTVDTMPVSIAESESDAELQSERDSEKEWDDTNENMKVKGKKYKCENCNDYFKTKCALKIHNRTHRNDCKLCELQISSSEELADHIIESHNEVLEKLYICTICDTGFANAFVLNGHSRQVHATSIPYACKNCEKIFFDESDLKAHQESHNEKKSFTCEYCQKVYTSTRRLHFHVKTQHTKGKPYKCELCEKSFNIKKNLDKHDRLCHVASKPATAETSSSVLHSKKTDQFACGICKQTFPNTSDLTPHLRGKHLNILQRRYACEICGERFSRHGLTIHLRESHPGRKRFECKICHRQYKSQVNLAAHFRTHTGEKPFSCTICSRTFCTTDLLKRHQRVHTGDRPYKCDLCGSTYKSTDALAIHKRTHTGEKPYMCERCSKCFTQKTLLNSHMLNVHKENDGVIVKSKPHICQDCGRSFSQKSYLIIHSTVHCGEKPFICEHCAKGFTHISQLTTHLTTHSADKPFNCTECGKGFRLKSQLKIHSRQHTGEKPHLCTYCGKSFTQRTSFVAHYRIHTGEKPYVCNDCGKRYRASSSFTKHCKTHARKK